ncbi:hypothetical protein [Streptomyces sp. VRA16 Mangrove soil]|uniref:hypothetical protein n=1 Tax=Streptomyces sp. VRA16 Mangrove soil TaxID=2817434 RepID=UPI001A9E6CBD|nr:hypothetical protein [Streptomyces sp. VRA16 Mangrove soil]MBO1334825.1 hypothetical protein [Streptomyces sp. VRA16 Mangrove soil]
MRRSVIVGAVCTVAALAAGALVHPVTPPSSTALATGETSGGGAWLLRTAERATQPPRPAAQVRGERLLSEAVTLLRDARSVRIVEDVTVGKGRPIHFDLRMESSGSCVGSLDAGPGKRGDFVFLAARKGHEAEGYLKYTPTALSELRGMALDAGPDIAQRVVPRLAMVEGKYVKLPQGPKGTGAFEKVCSVSQTLGGSGMAGDVTGTRARPVVQRAGRRVVPLVPPADGSSGSDSGSGNDSGSGTDSGIAYVDADGKPYLRSLEGASDGTRLSMRFSAYGDPVPARRPDPSLIVELPQDEASMFAV